MKTIITNDYEDMSEKAAQIIIETVKEKPNAVLGLATGATPMGLYRRLVADHKEMGTSYKYVRTINLDEYVGLTKVNPQSYAYFMYENLFCHIDIALKNTYIENGTALDSMIECKRYDKMLNKLPRDIQLLGLGSNGHIAFNEPYTSFSSTTHIVNLAENTIKDNAIYFDNIEQVPRQAYTMGIKSIMKAKQIIILASGFKKAEIVSKLVQGNVDSALPASILHNHCNCILILDKEAASKL